MVAKRTSLYYAPPRAIRNLYYDLLVASQQRYQKSHSFLGKERIISVLEKLKLPEILAEKQLKFGRFEIKLAC